jgi:hypothetical protein
MIGWAYPVHEWLPLLAIGFAALVYVVREGLELLGKSPGAELLRKENGDLVRRNQELEETVARHERLIGELRTKVSDLERTNQAAVLEALKEHERGARSRHADTTALLERAVEALEVQTKENV